MLSQNEHVPLVTAPHRHRGAWLPLPPLLMIALCRETRLAAPAGTTFLTNPGDPHPSLTPCFPLPSPSEFCDHQVQSCAMWTLNKCSLDKGIDEFISLLKHTNLQKTGGAGKG